MAAAGLLLAGFSYGQVDANRVVATVNGEPIKGSEYYHRMEFLPGVKKMYGGQAIESSPGFLTVVELIGEKIMYQLAKDKGVLPSKQEIDDELQLRLGQDPKYLEKWASTGQSQSDLEDAIRYELTKFKLQTAGITVTDQEIQNFYKQNPQRFTSERLLKLRVIAVNTDAEAKAVDADLKAGKEFTAVAKARSVDVTKATGGEIGLVPVAYLTQSVRPTVAALKIGQATPWLDVTDTRDAKGVTVQVKYQLVDVLPEKLQPLTKPMMISTRRLIMLERGREKNDIGKQINDMRAKSKVVINQKEFAALYDQLVSSGG
ncbi:MAG: peptidyl-prolyl cis-trans isomerase SurA [Fimbriimonadaceae bacterium]|jgi:hypothetical protein|nr:peptidyl-prolyl cis-trans isomerase SurA [Fimbriimonadaceae bacterium]